MLLTRSFYGSQNIMFWFPVYIMSKMSVVILNQYIPISRDTDDIFALAHGLVYNENFTDVYIWL